ncbi:TetR/AcrR family transcriptional regulator [Arthrobacter sp. Sa2CUA1]|uniref:TetR/AcrR family transcriptional regulator n=1 Tax=Arthrobacter gallicola TaxID=2762225 RepID=A0ABR8UN28_9MICC|nr:TetR/AcrR family transcriptional regulator [Arthrobacter gallicola]MBD7993959.1 TetR/AcrR family transcriptional regulator [Arthrobacter gallicola]
MGQHGDKAREALLDAAEELFARHGIDAVSNRRIAEHAGTANHSAVAYHFGGRDELVRTLITRHAEDTNRRRAALAAGLDDDAALPDVLACLILPWVEHLGSLPVPSWRARFVHQIRTTPSMQEVLANASVPNALTEELNRRVQAAGGSMDPSTQYGRSWILGNMVLSVCSEYEARVQDGVESTNWTGVGYFLIDACAGMLAAPATHPGNFIRSPSPVSLL